MNKYYFRGSKSKSGNLQLDNTKNVDSTDRSCETDKTDSKAPVLKFSGTFRPFHRPVRVRSRPVAGKHRGKSFPYHYRNGNSSSARRGRGKLANTLINRPRKRYCSMYHRYGYCKLGLRCQYIHNPNRIRLCRFVLTSGGCNNAGKCLLNHTPTEFNTPHCSFFLRGYCSKFLAGECPYTHVKIAKDAPICSKFAKEGYCKDGKSCPNEHVSKCLEFAEKGTCQKKDCPFTHLQAIYNKKSRDKDDAAAPPVETEAQASKPFNFSISASLLSSDNRLNTKEESYSDVESKNLTDRESESDAYSDSSLSDY